MPESVKKNERFYKYDDYKSWPLGESWELIYGVAYDMSPAPSKKHQIISRELGFIIHQYLTDKPCRLFFAPFDVFFPESDEPVNEIHNIVQPDLLIVYDKKKLIEEGCLGAPDIIVEITSPFTGAKDKKEKYKLYESHGVGEYWIIEPFDDTVMVFRLNDSGAYGAPLIYTVDEKLTSNYLPGLEINLNDVFLVD